MCTSQWHPRALAPGCFTILSHCNIQLLLGSQICLSILGYLSRPRWGQRWPTIEADNNSLSFIIPCIVHIITLSRHSHILNTTHTVSVFILEMSKKSYFRRCLELRNCSASNNNCCQITFKNSKKKWKMKLYAERNYRKLIWIFFRAFNPLSGRIQGVCFRRSSGSKLLATWVRRLKYFSSLIAFQCSHDSTPSLVMAFYRFTLF